MAKKLLVRSVASSEVAEFALRKVVGKCEVTYSLPVGNPDGGKEVYYRMTVPLSAVPDDDEIPDGAEEGDEFVACLTEIGEGNVKVQCPKRILGGGVIRQLKTGTYSAVKVLEWLEEIGYITDAD